MPLESGRGVPLQDAECQPVAITMLDGNTTVTVRFDQAALTFLEPGTFEAKMEIFARNRERIERCASRKYDELGAEDGVVTVEADDLKREGTSPT